MSEDLGYKVYILTRNKAKSHSNESMLYWNIQEGFVDPKIKEADHIINLAGSGIADGKWTKKRKKSILDSRVDTTELLISTIKEHNIPIQSYVSASAIGLYGDGGDQLLREEDGVVSKEFLSDICLAWEEAALQAQDLVQSLAVIRIGTVLSPTGGALEKMSKTIPLGVANYLGSGKQWMSWIHLDDICRIMLYAIDQTAPAFGIKMIFGEMARVVLNSSKVSSEKIKATGFKFSHPTLASALAELYK